jgi:hypothetical protein
MNKIIYKIFPVLTLAFALSMTACLTDSEYDNNQIGINPTNNKNYVEVHLTSGNNTNFLAYSFASVDKDTTITQLIPINLTSGAATSDVTITYQMLDTLNSALVDSLVNIDGLVLPDPTKITVLNTPLKVTIKKGSSTGYVQVKFNPSTLVGNTTIFGIKITAVSDPKYVISNLNVGYVEIGIKNKWDGIYLLKGYTLRAGDGARTGSVPPFDMPLITSGANSVQFGLLQEWADGSGVGIDYPVLTIDASNNVTIYSDAGAINNPGYKSTYNPTKREFYISLTWGAGPAARLATDTLTYIGPR